MTALADLFADLRNAIVTDNRPLTDIALEFRVPLQWVLEAQDEVMAENEAFNQGFDQDRG